MANTHEVLAGVKEYTLELLGEGYRDVAVDAADRAEAQAERAEAAAENAEVGIRDDTVAKNHLTSGLRGEIDGKTSKVYVDGEVGKKADKSHTHTSADITDAWHYVGGETYAGRVIKAHVNGHIYVREDPPAPDAVPRRKYVDDQVAKKADADHTHTAAQVGARPDSWTPTASDVGARPDDWTPTAEQVGAATPAYVDSRIQEVTGDQWPSNPEPGVIYWQAE